MIKNQLTPIESLKRSISKRFPDARVSLDRPRKAAGVWFLDIERASHTVIVQWRENKGFAITSSPGHGYGEGADEVHADEEAAYGRIVSLLLSRAYTSPPTTVTLRELRKESGLSQAELAELLDRQQGEISKIERRKDILLSTLTDYVRAVQGELQIIVRLPGGRVRRVRLVDNAADGPLSASAPRP